MLSTRAHTELTGIELERNKCNWRILVEEINLLSMDEKSPSVIYQNQRKFY